MMLIRLFLVISFLLFLTACGEKKAEPQKKSPKPTSTTQKIDVKKDSIQLDPPPKFKYEATGRRDPFEPLIVVSQQPVPLPGGEPQTPLQSYDLGQLRLVAIIIGKGPSSAMVLAPDGKGYILKKDVRVGKNSGKVIAIRADAVVVEEYFVDLSGETKKRTQEIQLPKREGA